MAVHVLTSIASYPLSAGAPGDSLQQACGRSAGIACRLVWDISHSVHAAKFASDFLAGPVRLVLRILFVLLLALLARFAAGRLIRRITARAAQENGNGRARALLGGERR